MKSVLLWSCLAIALLISGSADAARVSIACAAVGAELERCREGVEIWAERTGNDYELVSIPNNSNERLALFQQLLAAGDNSIDVFQIDVVWPGILANYFVDFKPHVAQDVIDRHFSVIIENNTVNGNLVAMPFYADAGVLYYRSDLLEKYGFQHPPATWDEMEMQARTIMEGERQAGNARFWGYLFQGRAYEGLTCNAIEWLDSYRAGTVLSDYSTITITEPDAIRAIRNAGEWVGSITPTGVLNYAEEEARGIFQSGNAVFMRNWPYAWSLLQSEGSPIRGKVGVITLPKGGEDGKPTGVLGGWQLAVSKFSDQKEEAIDLVRYMTSREEQRRRAILGSYPPTIVDLYDDEEVLEAVPLFGTLRETLAHAVARPSSQAGLKYNQLSVSFWNAVHASLANPDDTEENMESLARRLKRISRGNWVE